MVISGCEASTAAASALLEAVLPSVEPWAASSGFELFLVASKALLSMLLDLPDSLVPEVFLSEVTSGRRLREIIFRMVSVTAFDL